MINIEIKENVSLKEMNTFGVEAVAKRFVSVQKEEELLSVLKLASPPFFILGGGSNILLTEDVNPLVIRVAMMGKEIVSENEQFAWVALGAGESWHEVVRWSIEIGLSGIENLSLIPGTVGAAPIQNIGAYGVELKDVFEKLEAIHLDNRSKAVFYTKDCHFGYRQSIFKKQAKGKYCITRVFLKLNKVFQARLGYGALQARLADKGIERPTSLQISDLIMAIRQEKLPDPAILGNAGSFFKNPEIEENFFQQLKKQFPNIVYYLQPNGLVKIPAGWLIEQCGWKGRRLGETGCYQNQALVLVNYGNATGAEILAFSSQIVGAVFHKFGIQLEREVNVI